MTEIILQGRFDRLIRYNFLGYYTLLIRNKVKFQVVVDSGKKRKGYYQPYKLILR